MASKKEYLDFILDQLSELDGISYRAMMGEYILYYGGKIVGGIYDDRFLVKPTKSAAAMMPGAARELPYDGAKEMLMVDNVEDRSFLKELLTAIYEELPEPKKKYFAFISNLLILFGRNAKTVKEYSPAHSKKTGYQITGPVQSAQPSKGLRLIRRGR